MKKVCYVYFVFIIIINCWQINLQAQARPEFLNYWEDPYYINPAYVHFGYDAFLTLNTRTQWLKFPGAPVTGLFSVEVPIEKIRSQLAAKIMYDKIGYTNTFDFSLSYSYSARLNRKNTLNFGVAGVYQTRTYNYKEIDAENMFDPVLTSEKINGASLGNINFGMEYIYDLKLFVGLSANNFLSYFQERPIITATNYLYAKYITNYMSETNFYMDYGVALQQYSDLWIGNFMTSAYYDLNNSYSIQMQLFGSTAGDVGFTFGINLLRDLKLLCSYNYNYATVNYRSYGTFEFMLTYGIKTCPTCFNEW